MQLAPLVGLAEGYWGQVLLKVRARGRGRLGADKVLELREAWQLHRKNSVREWCCWGCLGVVGGVLRVWGVGILGLWGGLKWWVVAWCQI